MAATTGSAVAALRAEYDSVVRQLQQRLAGREDEFQSLVEATAHDLAEMRDVLERTQAEVVSLRATLAATTAALSQCRSEAARREAEHVRRLLAEEECFTHFNDAWKRGIAHIAACAADCVGAAKAEFAQLAAHLLVLAPQPGGAGTTEAPPQSSPAAAAALSAPRSHDLGVGAMLLDFVDAPQSAAAASPILARTGSAVRFAISDVREEHADPGERHRRAALLEEEIDELRARLFVLTKQLSQAKQQPPPRHQHQQHQQHRRQPHQRQLLDGSGSESDGDRPDRVDAESDTNDSLAALLVRASSMRVVPRSGPLGGIGGGEPAMDNRGAAPVAPAGSPHIRRKTSSEALSELLGDDTLCHSGSRRSRSPGALSGRAHSTTAAANSTAATIGSGGEGRGRGRGSSSLEEAAQKPPSMMHVESDDESDNLDSEGRHRSWSSSASSSMGAECADAADDDAHEEEEDEEHRGEAWPPRRGAAQVPSQDGGEREAGAGSRAAVTPVAKEPVLLSLASTIGAHEIPTIHVTSGSPTGGPSRADSLLLGAPEPLSGTVALSGLRSGSGSGTGGTGGFRQRGTALGKTQASPAEDATTAAIAAADNRHAADCEAAAATIAALHGSAEVLIADGAAELRSPLLTTLLRSALRRAADVASLSLLLAMRRDAPPDGNDAAAASKCFDAGPAFPTYSDGATWCESNADSSSSSEAGGSEASGSAHSAEGGTHRATAALCAAAGRYWREEVAAPVAEIIAQLPSLLLSQSADAAASRVAAMVDSLQRATAGMLHQSAAAAALIGNGRGTEVALLRAVASWWLPPHHVDEGAATVAREVAALLIARNVPGDNGDQCAADSSPSSPLVEIVTTLGAGAPAADVARNSGGDSRMAATMNPPPPPSAAPAAPAAAGATDAVAPPASPAAHPQHLGVGPGVGDPHVSCSSGSPSPLARRSPLARTASARRDEQLDRTFYLPDGRQHVASSDEDGESQRGVAGAMQRRRRQRASTAAVAAVPPPPAAPPAAAGRRNSSGDGGGTGGPALLDATMAQYGMTSSGWEEIQARRNSEFQRLLAAGGDGGCGSDERGSGSSASGGASGFNDDWRALRDRAAAAGATGAAGGVGASTWDQAGPPTTADLSPTTGARGTAAAVLQPPYQQLGFSGDVDVRAARPRSRSVTAIGRSGGGFCGLTARALAHSGAHTDDDDEECDEECGGGFLRDRPSSAGRLFHH